MKILLTGANGYIGMRLLPVLLNMNYQVICAVRDKSRFNVPYKNITVVEIDLLKPDTLDNIPKDIDGAFYLVHSMSSSTGDFDEQESMSATNFINAVLNTNIQHVVYLSGIVNDPQLSRHLKSRKGVEEILDSGHFHLTTLRTGIIIGSGSSSFEIVRDLVEKLPVMITPQWIQTRSQPIAIRNVIEFLSRCIFCAEVYDNVYDIAGPDILTYKQMMLQLAEVRGLKRFIFSLPVMTPRLSSYWLYFVTSTSYFLAVNLVNSMKVEVVAQKNNLAELLNVNCITYKEAVKMAFNRIAQNEVISSWKDSMVSSHFSTHIQSFIQVPTYGCFVDHRKYEINNTKDVINNIWNIGGENGWYTGNLLWRLRGLLDKLVGGVGLRRGRTHAHKINAGDALDFWRVLLADKEKGRLLLYAEMRLPGEAWLEFKIENNLLHQTATFRPKGLLGRLYWYAVLPFHSFIFGNMIKKISKN